MPITRTTQPKATFSDAVMVGGPGRWIFVSGQIGLDESGSVVAGGFAAEADQTFANIAAILAGQGASIADIVKATAYIADFDANFRGMAEARARAFGDAPPAFATLGVSGMAFGALVEVEAVAFLADPPS